MDKDIGNVSGDTVVTKITFPSGLICMDCTVAHGFGDESIFASRAYAIAQGIKARYEIWKRNPSASPLIVKVHDGYSLFEHMRAKCGVYRFCPQCGNHIDWDIIMKSHAEG